MLGREPIMTLDGAPIVDAKGRRSYAHEPPITPLRQIASGLSIASATKLKSFATFAMLCARAMRRAVRSSRKISH